MILGEIMNLSQLLDVIFGIISTLFVIKLTFTIIIYNYY